MAPFLRVQFFFRHKFFSNCVPIDPFNVVCINIVVINLTQKKID
jgi:hypothetical protein